MPHVNRRATPIGCNPIALTEVEDDLTVERNELAAQIAEDPAFLQILEHLRYAASLGFDPTSPEIIRRAWTAGRTAHEAAVEPEPVVTKPQARSPFRTWDPHHEPVVYYMQHDRLVKIGTSIRVYTRSRDIGARKVMAVELGDTRLESVRHQQFAHLRSHGEWFRMASELAEHIVDVRQRFHVDAGRSTEEWLAELCRPTRRAGLRPTRSMNAMQPILDPNRARPGALLRAADAALAADVSRMKINAWVKAGLLIPADTTKRGAPVRLYRLSDVLRVAREVRRSTAKTT